jgi:hypothetical protein
MDETGILSIIALSVSIGGVILTIINHKRVIFKFCGRTLDLSFDLNNTTPPLSSIAPADIKLNTPTNPPPDIKVSEK